MAAILFYLNPLRPVVPYGKDYSLPLWWFIGGRLLRGSAWILLYVLLAAVVMSGAFFLTIGTIGL